jgi:hypothetical protein
MKAIGFVVGAIAVVSGGCVTASPGEPVGRVNFGSISTVGAPVGFDHGCPKERIRVVGSEGSTVDLDVCGAVRRYKSVASGAAAGPAYTWMDVTGSYPAGALPAPLPPAEPTIETVSKGGASPAGPFRDLVTPDGLEWRTVRAIHVAATEVERMGVKPDACRVPPHEDGENVMVAFTNPIPGGKARGCPPGSCRCFEVRMERSTLRVVGSNYSR